MTFKFLKVCAFLAVTSTFATLPSFAEESVPANDEAAVTSVGNGSADEGITANSNDEDVMTRRHMDRRWDRHHRWNRGPRFGFEFRFGPRWGHGHRGAWTCYARNWRGRTFAARGWNLNQTRWQVMRSCDRYSRGQCRFLGCR